MNFEGFVGMTLAEIEKKTSVFWKEIRIFLLDSMTDVAGKQLMTAYTMRQVLHAHPELAGAKVVSACNYYGEAVLRIVMPECPAEVACE